MDEARRGTLPGMVRTGATFADAAAEYLRYIEADRARKPSTVRDYRSVLDAHLLPAFGAQRIEEITPASIDRWRGLAGWFVKPHEEQDDLVFLGEFGGYVDGRALRRRYVTALKRAALRPLRFHDLRHIFGTRMIAKADIPRVQEWMGHADVQTTMRYLHYVPREDDAALVAEAFELDDPAAPR